jgi:predicted nucleotidyltransferase
MINNREEILKSLRNYFDRDANLYKLDMVFLYGSWAKGFPRNDSDVDIAVVFSDEPSSDEESFRKITNISLSLSKELGREVNVIQIYKDFRKPMLYYNAIILGLPVYIKEQDKYIRIKNDAIYFMEDYSIFGIDWQYEVATKNLEASRHA